MKTCVTVLNIALREYPPVKEILLPKRKWCLRSQVGGPHGLTKPPWPGVERTHILGQPEISRSLRLGGGRSARHRWEGGWYPGPGGQSWLGTGAGTEMSPTKEKRLEVESAKEAEKEIAF